MTLEVGVNNSTVAVSNREFKFQPLSFSGSGRLPDVGICCGQPSKRQINPFNYNALRGAFFVDSLRASLHFALSPGFQPAQVLPDR